MELVDRYLQAIRFWLPKSQRQEGLLTELGEDLNSQIEDKESELGRALDEAEVSTILKRCGSPLLVAGRLRPQRQLIGPTLFPIYQFVLKMVLLWILLPVFIFIVGPVNVANTNGDWGLATIRTLGTLWYGSFIAAAVITLVFAILEYSQVQLGLENKWDPRSLPRLQKQGPKISFLKTACELFFGLFGFVWLLLMPHYPFMIFGPAAAFLKPAPIWHAFYMPVLLVSLVGLLRPAIMLARPQWTAFPLWGQLLQTVVSLILISFFINAVHPHDGGLLPLVLPADNLAASAHYMQVATIVNFSMMICVASMWFGFCIAGIQQTWQLLRYLRKRISCASNPVPMQLQ